MSARLLSEDLVSLAKAARLVPGGPVHLSTIHRWRLRGVNGIKLETVVVGRRKTSVEALHRFILATTAAADSGSEGQGQPQSRLWAIEAAERELEKAGI